MRHSGEGSPIPLHKGIHRVDSTPNLVEYGRSGDVLSPKARPESRDFEYFNTPIEHEDMDKGWVGLRLMGQKRQNLGNDQAKVDNARNSVSQMESSLLSTDSDDFSNPSDWVNLSNNKNYLKKKQENLDDRWDKWMDWKMRLDPNARKNMKDDLERENKDMGIEGIKLDYDQERVQERAWWGRESERLGKRIADKFR